VKSLDKQGFIEMRKSLSPIQLTSVKRNDHLLRGTSAPNLKEKINVGALVTFSYQQDGGMEEK